jgi:glycosyltransferase involved in cell wall biosynthesis
MNSDNSPSLTVVSRSFPPQVSGSAILLANLLTNYSGKTRAVAGYTRDAKIDPTFTAPCPTHYLRLPRLLPRAYEFLRTRSPTTTCRIIFPSIRRALKVLGGNVVLASFPSEEVTVASFLAARELNLPYYVHMHDLWLENTPVHSPAVRFAMEWEPVLLKESKRVLCMTETMQQHYETKYGIRTDLLPHCIPDQDLISAPCAISPTPSFKPTVLFVGAVSQVMNLDALKVLASASELLPKEYELLYCGSSDLDSLSRVGIRSSRLRAKFVSRSEVRRLQSEAHVLVAPLSHKNCSAEEVRTVFSTKLLEYLVSGRPIVVFAPSDSYHAQSASKNGWGHVVTENSPEALATAIRTVTEDINLASRLVKGALKEARSRSAKHHASRLRQWVLADC